MKKIISTAMAVLMGLTLFVGCSYNTKDYESGNAVGNAECTITAGELKSSGGYWSTASQVIEKDGEKVLEVNVGSYARYRIDLPYPIDISSEKAVIEVEAAADADLKEGDNSTFKMGFFTSPTMGCEIYNKENVTKFMDKSTMFDKSNKVAKTDYAKYTAELKYADPKAYCNETGDPSVGKIKEAYLPCITYLTLDTQGNMSGKIYIKSITFKK